MAGFIWLFFWIPFYDVPERQSRLSRDELAFIQSDRDESHTESPGKSRWLSLLKYRQAWSIIIARFMTDPVWWFFLIWLPDYFKKTRHLDIQHSWIHLATIYAIVTVLSNIGGWLPGVSDEAWLDRHPCAQNLNVPFCALRGADFIRDVSWRLERSSLDRTGWSCPPGLVGEPLLNSF